MRCPQQLDLLRNGRRAAGHARSTLPTQTCSIKFNRLHQQLHMPHSVLVSAKTWSPDPLAPTLMKVCRCFTGQKSCQLQLHWPEANKCVASFPLLSICFIRGLLLYLEESDTVYHGHKSSAAKWLTDPSQVFQTERAVVETRNQET